MEGAFFGRSTPDTTPIPLHLGEEWRCRHAFGYGLDGSELPCYYLLPERTNTGGFCLVDGVTATYFDLRTADSIQNLGLGHFYEAFGLRRGKDWSRDLRSAFGFAEECRSEPRKKRGQSRVCLPRKSLTMDKSIAPPLVEVTLVRPLSPKAVSGLRTVTLSWKNWKRAMAFFNPPPRACSRSRARVTQLKEKHTLSKVGILMVVGAAFASFSSCLRCGRLPV